MTDIRRNSLAKRSRKSAQLNKPSTLEAKIKDSHTESSADEVSQSDYSLADEASALKKKRCSKLADKVG